MSIGSVSLLTFIDAPVVVGDPEGRTAYVNPAFTARFRPSGDDPTGQPLSVLFEGGVREAVLRAVVECCEQGRTVRFRLRHGGVAYAAVASPIVAEDARVGVVILLVESSAAEERLIGLQRELSEPVGELRRVLEELLEQTGGRRDERYRALVEDGSRALARLRKRCDELTTLVAGPPAAPRAEACFDALRVLRDAAARVRGDFAALGIELEVLVPAQLPRVRGDGSRVEMALVRLLQERLSTARESRSVTLAARPIGRGEARSIVISIGDTPAAEGSAKADPPTPVPPIVLEIVRELGGEIRTAADPLMGRTTAIRLDVKS
jgi:nitrogen-specific signal transduction histidine kinase